MKSSTLSIPRPSRWRIKKWNFNQLWLILFSVWLVLLSGGLMGSPGMLQAVRLNGLLKDRETQMQVLRNEIQKLESEVALLEKNRVVQRREIRRILGYAAPGELIFDFTGEDQVSPSKR